MTVQHIKEFIQGQPSLEASRQGLRFYMGNNAAVTGIAPVQALPTTAAQWVLKNASATKTMFLEGLGLFLTSGTPGVGGLLLATLASALSADFTANKTGVAMASSSRSATQTTAAVCDSAKTISTPAAPVWFPLATRPDANVTAFAGSTFCENRRIEGKIAIPPGGYLGLALVSPAGTSPLFVPFAEWQEADVTLV